MLDLIPIDPSIRRLCHECQEGIEPVGFQWFAGGRPGRLPARLGVRFEARGHLRPRHLVTEKFAPYPPVGVLMPAEVAIRVNPGPALAFTLDLSGRGAPA